jgi:hypothetical protein
MFPPNWPSSGVYDVGLNKPAALLSTLFCSSFRGKMLLKYHNIPKRERYRDWKTTANKKYARVFRAKFDVFQHTLPEFACKGIKINLSQDDQQYGQRDKIK